MKIWRSGLLGSRLAIASLTIVGLAVLLAFSGCEGTTEEDSSGVDSYLKAHPYTSASRDTPYTMTISPVSVSLIGGALYASFTVSGGAPPYSWTSGNTAMGTVSYSASSSYLAAYTAVPGAYGVNVITVIDAEGRTASATITQAL